MNTFCKLSLLLFGAFATVPMGFAQDIDQPMVGNYSDYTGDSFSAHWGHVSGATDYLLNVYRLDKTDETTASASFNDKTLPAECTADCNYLTEMGTHCLMADGEGIVLTLPDGQFSQLELHALQFDNEGVTGDNTSYFLIELFNTAGERIMYGQGNANYFAANESLDLFEAFGLVVPEINSVRISLVTEENHTVGKLAVYALEYGYYTPRYVVKDEAVSDTQYLLTNLAPESTYFYNVRARKGDAISHKSADKCVDAFLTPVTLPAADVAEESFTARWERTPKSLKHTVTNYRVETLEAGADIDIFADTFSSAYVGTVADPYPVSSFDGYADHMGWIGSKMAIAEGMIGTTEGSKNQGYRGYNYIQTPVLDLSAGGGVYTIHLKAYTNGKAETLSLYNTINIITDENGKQSLNIHTVDVPSSGYVEASWTMDDGMKDMRISIEPANLNSFFIDDFTITQQLDEPKTVFTLVGDGTFDADCTEMTFDNLDPEGRYAYNVRGFRYDFYGYEEWSEVSEYQYVTLNDSANLVITPANSAGATSRYDLSGRRIADDARLDGLHFYVQGGKKILKR